MLRIMWNDLVWSFKEVPYIALTTLALGACIFGLAGLSVLIERLLLAGLVSSGTVYTGVVVIWCISWWVVSAVRRARRRGGS